MIKNYFSSIYEKKLKKEKEALEYANTIDDEIVKKSSFMPLVLAGKSFYSHTLINDSSGNLVFRVNKFLPTFYISAILIISLSFLIMIFAGQEIKDTAELYFSSLFIVGMGILLIYGILKNLNSKIFDFENGYFYYLKYKHRIFEILYNDKYKGKIIPIKEIYAIQIISELIEAKRAFYSYELNLILKDSSRINIVDHIEIKKIRLEAKTIADKLKIKVWDMTNIN